mgnify:CR=1 FL=1
MSVLNKFKGKPSLLNTFPIAVLLLPTVFWLRELLPIATLMLPSVLFINAANPTATLKDPFIFSFNYLYTTNFPLQQTEDFDPYFAGRKRLLPRPSDLR